MTIGNCTAGGVVYLDVELWPIGATVSAWDWVSSLDVDSFLRERRIEILNKIWEEVSNEMSKEISKEILKEISQEI